MRGVVLLLAILHQSSGIRFSLGGFRCPSQKLKFPIVLEDGNDELSSICKDLSIDVEDGDKEGKDSATQVIVEVSSSPMPSKGKVLLEDVLPLNAVTLNENLRVKKLSSIGSAFKYCGNFYIVVSLQDGKGNALEFDTLPMQRKCSDKPGLSLKVEHRTKKVVGTLRRGSKNPFNLIGINSISVQNFVKNCTLERSATDEGCGDQTSLAPRWEGDVPDVVAFYIPLSWEEAAPDDMDSLLNKVGFKNGTGDTWFFDEPAAMNNLINLGIENMNMFEKPLFLHDTQLIDPAMNKERRIGEAFAKIDLDKTAIPLGAPWQGLLVVALDPLWKFEDIDRTDNVFVQYVRVNGTDDNGNWLMDEPICNVQPVGKSLGKF